MKKVWNIREIDEKEVKEYMQKHNISEILAKMLICRDITLDKVDSYLNPTIDMLYDPYLLNDMDKIVTRIIKARKDNEKVCIYGDYDVDGITSIIVLYNFLKELNIEVSYYLPGRIKEGYGLSKEALDTLSQEKVTLCITVDCGISAHNEVIYAKELGIDVCIIDHHECTRNLPKAHAVINPKRLDSNYPFSHLAGVGVTFKVIMGLSIKLKMNKESYLKYLDMVAIGTVADIVELKDENRVIAYHGIRAINKTKNNGLKQLIKIAKTNKVDSQAISFAIAPRINASGRMADAGMAVKLFLADTEIEAEKYAKELDNQNKLRQTVEKEIYDEAIDLIQKENLDKKQTIVLFKKDWHQGVIGIVASKLVEKFSKPVILFSIDENNIAKGSGRTFQGISLYAALTKCTEILESFGGHEQAAGLCIKESNIEEFKTSFDLVVAKLKKEEFVNIINIDTEIKKHDLNINLIKDIERLAPFGQKNNIPIFIYKNLKVGGISTLKDGKHLKVFLQDDGNVIEGIAFSQGERRDEIKIGDKIDVACQITINEYMNQKRIQMNIRDFKKKA